MSIKKKILFRADAAPHIGIGDLMSLIHLSRYLDNSWEVFFVIKDYEAGMKLCEKYGIEATILSSDISIEDEVNFLNSFIVNNEIDIVFFEITERPLTDYKKINKNVKKACVSFDGEILDDMTLVVDWDTEANKFHDPKKYPNTKFLLGYEYVILPKEFFEIDFSKVKRTFPPKKILIAMGGADELDFTSKVVEALLALQLNLELKIIVGSGYKNIESLKKLIQNSSHQILKNIKNMRDEYLDCDAAIGAGGLTISELVATKTPAAIVATYEHQVHRCETFERKNLIFYLGFRDVDKRKLNFFLEQDNIPISFKIFFKTDCIIYELEKINF